MVKNCIVGKKTAIIKIPPSRSAESTFKNHLLIIIEMKMQSFMTK